MSLNLGPLGPLFLSPVPSTRIPAYVNKIGGILNGFYRMIFNLIELDILPKKMIENEIFILS